jgi:hypothetical protein
MWGPERYRVLEANGNSEEYTFDQIVAQIVDNKVHHHSTIKKITSDSWTKVGILMEFREALKIQIQNN